jgi:hypothetical protein
MSDAREQIEDAANRIRSELLLTLKELDRRRHRVLDPRYQLTAHRQWFIGLGAAAVGLIALGAVVASVRAHNRRPRLRRDRVRGLIRAWEHPERLASGAARRPAPTEMATKLLIAFVGALGVQLGRRAALRLLPEQSETRGGNGRSLSQAH